MNVCCIDERVKQLWKSISRRNKVCFADVLVLGLRFVKTLHLIQAECLKKNPTVIFLLRGFRCLWFSKGCLYSCVCQGVKHFRNSWDWLIRRFWRSWGLAANSRWKHNLKRMCSCSKTKVGEGITLGACNVVVVTLEARFQSKGQKMVITSQILFLTLGKCLRDYWKI